jgi:hypothetical protein
MNEMKMRGVQQRHRHLHHSGAKRKVSLTSLLLVLACLILGLYVIVLAKIHTPSGEYPHSLEAKPAASNNKQQQSLRYPQWKQIAVDLAKLPASQVLEELETNDPFGVRAFESKLLEKESTKEAILTMDELASLFACPSDRMTLPDQRDLKKSRAFRSNQEGTFLFFQHLRKAGM